MNTSDTEHDISDVKRRLADYALIFELLGSFTGQGSEDTVVNRLFEVMVQFTAATNILFLPVVDGKPQPIKTMQPVENEQLAARQMFRCIADVCISENGFCLPIGTADDTLGVVSVDGIPLSERVGHYVDLAQTVSHVFYLAIANVRGLDLLKKLNSSLDEQRERLSVTLSSIGDGVIATDTQARVTMLNGVAELLTGWTSEEATGRPLLEVFNIINETTRNRQLDPVAEALASGKVVALANHTALISKDGTERSIADSCAPIKDARHNIVGAVLIFRDVTEEYRMQRERDELVEQLKSTNWELESLGQITDSTLSSLSLDEMLETLLGRLVIIMRADAASALLVEEDEIRVRTRITKKGKRPHTHTMKIGEGFAGNIAASGMPLYSSDAASDPLITNPHFSEEGVQSIVGVPIKSGHETIGVLHVDWHRFHPRVPSEIKLLEVVAERSSAAIVNARLHEQTDDLKKLLELQIERMPIAHILWDVDFRAEMWNPAAEKIFGYSAEEAIGKHPYQFIVPAEAKPAVDDIWSRLLSGDDAANSLNENLTKDGRTITCHWSNAPIKSADGTVLGVLSMVEDVSEQLAAQKALADEKERLSVTLTSIGDGVIATDTDGNVLLLNKVAQELTGWSQREAYGVPVTSVFDIIKEKSKKSAASPVLKALSKGQRVSQAGDTVLIAKNGAEISVSDSCAPIRDSRNEIIGAVLVFRDITQEKRKRSLTEALNKIHEAVHSTLHVDSVVEQVMKMAADAMDCDAAGLLLKVKDRWVIKHTSGLPSEVMGMSFTDDEAPHLALTAERRQVLVINDPRSNEYVTRPLMSKLNIESLLAVPLVVKDEVIGILAFNHHTNKHKFGDAETEFAQGLASTVSFALENARLYRSEKMIAETLQESLFKLPPHLDNLEFSHLYRSATASAKVGGDFYDLFELGGGKVGILIGDVSGKGIEAASVTALVKTSIRAYVDLEASPARVVKLTNSLVTKTTPQSTFVTVFFGILDLKTGVLVYCNAGHPAPLIRRISGDVASLEFTSPAIGFFSEFDYLQSSIVIDRGDIMVAYTDGVIEARRGYELFGEKRLDLLVASAPFADSREAVDTLFSAIQDFTGNKLADDVAIISVRRL